MKLNFEDRFQREEDGSESNLSKKIERKDVGKNPYEDLFETKLAQYENSNKVTVDEQSKKNEKHILSERKETAEGLSSGNIEMESDQIPKHKTEKRQILEKNAGNHERPDMRISIDKKVKELPRQELEAKDRDTFQGGNYRTVETTEDMVLYRVYGQGAGKQGRFLTTEIPTDRMNVKIEMALDPGWRNSRQYFCEVSVPKGTVLNIGKCEVQKMKSGEILRGGAEQIMVSPDFIEKHPDSYKEEHLLHYTGNYRLFDKIAKRIEPQ